jgi:hypothetical protein
MSSVRGEERVAALSGAAALSLLLMCSPRHGNRTSHAFYGADAIKHAAELYRDIEGVSGCPTLKDLVTAKKLDRTKTDDPWGHPYQLVCVGEEFRVVSAGKDGRFDSEDDVASDFTQSDLARVRALE